jgi:hypothetical protein
MRRINGDRIKLCKYCGGNRVDYRPPTKDLRCKCCGGITPVQKSI